MKNFLLIARPRSGTHLLREFLSGVPHLFCFSEVFHNISSQGDYLYWPYYAGRLAADPALTWGRGDQMADLWGGYNNFLSAKAKSHRPQATAYLTTVNYNSLHSMDGCWRNLSDPPTLFGLAKKQGSAAIHLVRSNVLRALVSELRARQSGIWHLRVGNDVALPPVRLNTRGLLDELTRREQEISWVRGWLSGFSEVLELQYESLLNDKGMLTEAVAQRLSAFLGATPTAFATPTLKPTAGTSLAADIDNFDDVAAALRGTRFEAFLIE